MALFFQPTALKDRGWNVQAVQGHIALLAKLNNTREMLDPNKKNWQNIS